MTGIISGFPGLGRVYQAEERLTKPHWQVDEPGWGWGGEGKVVCFKYGKLGRNFIFSAKAFLEREGVLL